MSGQLLVIGTPLGNLEDISPRALEALREARLIACEDTRRTSRLLAHFGIRTTLVSCHRFNERARREPLLQRLRDGESVALVSDGGTPGVSDPGADLVRAALDESLTVVPVPGPSAVVALLSVCGFPADRFVFDGFLPHRAGERRRRLRELRRESRTIVVFETPHRIHAALRDIGQVLGDRPLVLGRELTKLHETIVGGTASQVAQKLGDPARGEITLVIGPPLAVDEESPGEESADRLLAAWRAALREAAGDRREALRAAARQLGLSRSELKRALMELGAED